VKDRKDENLQNVEDDEIWGWEMVGGGGEDLSISKSACSEVNYSVLSNFALIRMQNVHHKTV
jgi:hypothetical protein